MNQSFDLTYFRGRVALKEILVALGVSPGDRVAIQAFTCVAVPEAVWAVGATPVYVDTALDDVTMCPDDLRKKLNGVCAIVAQHTFGIPAHMDRILEIAGDIPVIEDCCHTYDSEYDGKKVGGLGKAAFYSFEWGKPVIAGIGGAAITTDPELHRRLALSRERLGDCGFVQDRKISLQYAGFSTLYRPRVYWQIRDIFHLLGKANILVGNYHEPQGTCARSVSEILGAFENMKMAPSAEQRLARAMNGRETFKSRSAALSKIYGPAVENVGKIPEISEKAKVVFARFPILTQHKNELLRRAREQRVEVSNWYETPAHPLKGADLEVIGYELGSCPNSEKLCDEIVSLPINLNTSEQEASRIADFLSQVRL